MANEQNLINLKDRPQRERKEIARMGAIASNKVQAERKSLKEELLLLLSSDDMQKKISLALLQKAQTGDTKAFEVIRDTIGEKQKEVVEISKTTDETIKEVEDYLGSKKEVDVNEQ